MAYLKNRLVESRRYSSPVIVNLGDEPSGLRRDWGAFLAGYITAEGSLGIGRVARNRYAPRLTVRVRADDSPLLEQLALRARVGHTHTYAQSKGCDVAVWTVTGATDLTRITGILERHELRGRKAREYLVWQKAVRIYASDAPRPQVHQKIAPLYEALRAERRHRS